MTNDNYAMKVTDIYEAMNSKAEVVFEWLQAHLSTGCCWCRVASPYGLQGCCSVGNGHVSGSFMESYGSLMIANPKHADGLR